jgi:predicted nucleic acid-binding protein
MMIIADTGFIIAVSIATERYHQACAALYHAQKKIYLPQSTLAETAYLLTKLQGNRVTAYFLNGLEKSRYEVVALTSVDITRTAQLLVTYADSRLDFVDASVVAVAERLGITRILTLDQRDFHIIRPNHCPYFDLLPQA